MVCSDLENQVLKIENHEAQLTSIDGQDDSTLIFMSEIIQELDVNCKNVSDSNEF